MMERVTVGALGSARTGAALWNEPSIDYNLGVVYGELQQPQEAAQALERFCAMPIARWFFRNGSRTPKRLAAYERSLSRLSVTVTMPSGSSEPNLFLDGSLRSKLPDGNTPPPGYLFATAGSHQVRVASSGLRDYSVSVDLKAGELRKLDGILLPKAVTRRCSAIRRRHKTPAFGHAALLQALVVLGRCRWWRGRHRWHLRAAAAGSFHRVAPGSTLTPSTCRDEEDPCFALAAFASTGLFRMHRDARSCAGYSLACIGVTVEGGPPSTYQLLVRVLDGYGSVTPVTPRKLPQQPLTYPLRFAIRFDEFDRQHKGMITFEVTALDSVGDALVKCSVPWLSTTSKDGGIAVDRCAV